MIEFVYTGPKRKLQLTRYMHMTIEKLTLAVRHIEHDIDEATREKRNHDQAHDGVDTRQQASVEGEEDKPVDDSVGTLEACS